MNTYSSLRTAVIRRVGRDDIAEQFDDMLSLVEPEIWKRLRVREMEHTQTLSGSSRRVNLPSDYVGLRRVVPVNSGNYYKELRVVSPNALPLNDSPGIPSRCSITDKIDLDCALDGQLNFTYYRKPAALSATATTNDVLTAHPRVYFYGLCAEGYAHSDDSQQEAKYRVLYYTAIDDANNDHLNSIGAAPSVEIDGEIA